MKHNPIWMIVGCLLPLWLIFVLPLVGIKGNYIFLIFFIAMFACHFLMMGKHGGHQHGQGQEHQPGQGNQHEHQHHSSSEKEKTI